MPTVCPQFQRKNRILNPTVKRNRTKISFRRKVLADKPAPISSKRLTNTPMTKIKILTVFVFKNTYRKRISSSLLTEYLLTKTPPYSLIRMRNNLKCYEKK